MAGSLTDFSENELLDHILGTGSFTSPTNVYSSLFTVAPTDAGGGTEVTGGSYARVITAFDAAASGATANTANVNFPSATAGWGTVVAFAIFDAITAGNMLFWGDLTVSKVVNSGTQARFLAGDVDLTLD